MKKIIRLMMLMILALFSVSEEAASEEKGKKVQIYTNGVIIPMTGEGDRLEAVAVIGDEIAATGGIVEILEEFQGAEVTDLNGKTLMPGFIEGHAHLLLEGAMADFTELSPLTHDTIEDMKRDFYSVKPNENGWVYVVGWENNGFELSIEEMDEAFPDNPVIVYQKGHGVWANTRTFEVRGVDKNTKAPGSSEYLLDNEGELTGYVSGMAGVFYMGGGSYPKPEVSNILKVSDRYAGMGFTTISEKALNNREDLEKLKDVSQLDELKLRIVASVIDSFPNFKEVLVELDGYENDLLRFPLVKTWVDGAVQGGNIDTALQYKLQEFNALKGPWGTQEEYNEIALAGLKAGKGFSFHANGEASLKIGLDAAEYAIEQGKILGIDTSDFRVQPVHISLSTPELLEQMKRIGASPTFMSGHFYHNGSHILNTFFGEIAHEYAFLVGSAFELGLAPSIHNDAPVTPTQPWMMIQSMVTRKTREGDELGPDERISVYQALEAYTKNPAKQFYLEDRVGTLEIGKKADFVIIDRNPLETRAEKLSDIKVITTLMNGRVTYQSVE